MDKVNLIIPVVVGGLIGGSAAWWFFFIYPIRKIRKLLENNSFRKTEKNTYFGFGSSADLYAKLPKAVFTTETLKTFKLGYNKGKKGVAFEISKRKGYLGVRIPKSYLTDDKAQFLRKFYLIDHNKEATKESLQNPSVLSALETLINMGFDRIVVNQDKIEAQFYFIKTIWKLGKLDIDEAHQAFTDIHGSIKESGYEVEKAIRESVKASASLRHLFLILVLFWSFGYIIPEIAEKSYYPAYHEKITKHAFYTSLIAIVLFAYFFYKAFSKKIGVYRHLIAFVLLSSVATYNITKGAIIYANAVFDKSPRSMAPAAVWKKWKRYNTYSGYRYYLQIEPMTRGRRSEVITVPYDAYIAAEPSISTVKMGMRRGALGLMWIDKYEAEYLDTKYTQFQSIFYNKLIEEKYDELHKAGKILREKRPKFTDGDHKLEHFYRGLAGGAEFGKIRDWDKELKNILKWQEIYPEDPTAVVAELKYWLAYAWHGRGTDYAKYLSSSQKRKFKTRLEKAMETFTTKKNLGSQDPEWFASAILLFMARNERNFYYHIKNSFDEGIKLNPYYESLHKNRAMAYLPRWGGSVEMFKKVVNDSVEITKDKLFDTMYWHIGMSIYSMTDSKRFYKLFDYERIKTSYDDIEKLHPNDEYLVSQQAAFACGKGDAEEFFPLKPRIPEKPNLQIWRSLGWHYRCTHWEKPAE